MAGDCDRGISKSANSVGIRRIKERMRAPTALNLAFRVSRNEGIVATAITKISVRARTTAPEEGGN